MCVREDDAILYHALKAGELAKSVIKFYFGSSDLDVYFFTAYTSSIIV